MAGFSPAHKGELIMALFTYNTYEEFYQDFYPKGYERLKPYKVFDLEFHRI